MTVGATAAASTQPFGGSERREMKRKTIYSIIVVALFGFAALWYLPSHIWSAQSMDGAGPVPTDQANEGKGFGPSGRGVGGLWGTRRRGEGGTGGGEGVAVTPPP